MEDEIFVAGINISPAVIETIIRLAAEKVEGVVGVGGTDITSRTIALFSARKEAKKDVELNVSGDKIVVSIRVAVYFGYKFTTLANEIREAVADAIKTQVGVDVESIDIFIDGLVFPKE